MHRIVSSGIAAIVLLLMAVFTLGPQVAAQDTDASAMATHPVVGVWRTAVSNTGDTPFTSFSTFHADGSYLEVLPDGTICSGVWRPTGERTADVTLYVYFSIDDRLVLGEGRLAVEVDETGNALTEAGTVVGHYEDGSLAIAIESPATGIRLEVLPVEPLGTPVVPGMETPGTPAP